VEKCPECHNPRRAAGGLCRYCERAKERVTPGRNVPVGGALRIFVVGNVVANAVVFGARAVLYVLSYLAVGDLRNGDFAALDRIHTLHTWTVIDLWATVLSVPVLARLLRHWMDAGNAHAMTRPEIGLGWFRTMPSSKPFQRWQWVQTFGYLLVVVLNVVFRNAISSDQQLRTWAVLQVLLCSAVIAGSIGAAVEARHMTSQLMERITFLEQAEQAEQAEQSERDERAAEPEPIA
jgi:hypothetical protein